MICFISSPTDIYTALFSSFIYHLYYNRIHTRFDIPRLVALFYVVRANLGLRGFISFIPRDLFSRMGLSLSLELVHVDGLRLDLHVAGTKPRLQFLLGGRLAHQG